jgi:hypothetical protein
MDQERSAEALPRRPGLAILVLGSDAFLEALPATPIQLVGAALAIGFDIVVPASWGDELVAELALEELARRLGKPAIFCACQRVLQRLLAKGPELEPLLLRLPPPPVALARYLRETYATRVGGLAFVGRCPSARPPHYDTWFEPQQFLAILRENNLDPSSQPPYLDGVLPPEMRRFRSLPGGVPSSRTLETLPTPYRLVVPEGQNLAVEMASELISGESVLLDPAAALGCTCAGLTPVTSARSARPALTSIEPPASSNPVISVPNEWRQNGTEIPAVSRLFQNSIDAQSPLRKPLARPAITPGTVSVASDL